MSKRDEIREKAVQNLQEFRVLMLDGHFDFGNGYHGRVYLNPHQLFRYPSTIWRFAQDLLDVLPASVLDQTEVVAGPATGGALLAHTLPGCSTAVAPSAPRPRCSRRSWWTRIAARDSAASTASRSRASGC